MVVKAEFFFELLIAMLYPVPFVIEAREINRRQMLRHVAEKWQFISVLCKLVTS